MKDDKPTDPSKRRLLTSSAVAALALAGGVWVYQNKDERVIEEDLSALIETSTLDIPTQHLLASICSAVLIHELPKDVAERSLRIKRCLSYASQYCLSLPDYLQDELTQLFELMKYPPSRYLATGLWKNPIAMNDQEVIDMMLAMQNSGNRLQRRVYGVFRDVIMAGYYGDRASWAGMNYPGPVIDFKQNG
jgi:hypothetical protein